MVRTAYLEQRIGQGEEFIASHPTDKEAKQLYWRYVEEYVSLKEEEERAEDIKAVWLHLPPGVKWQRGGFAEVHDEVRVLFAGQPEDSRDITRGELRELLETTAMVKQARLC